MPNHKIFEHHIDKTLIKGSAGMRNLETTPGMPHQALHKK